MNKLKRGLSLLLTLVMVLSMIPVSHAHGAAAHSCTIGGQNVTWKEWTSANSLPTTAGNYYLTKDVTLTSRADLIDGLVLCLNGKTLTAPEIMVGYGTTVTITDCVGTGKLTTSASTNVLSVNGTCNFYGGTITGTNRSGNAGGVYVNNVFNMYGGEISGNKATRGAGVYISTSDFWGTTGVFNMYGGSVINNTATNQGGGVYVNRGTTFNMYSGTNLHPNTCSMGAAAYVEGVFNQFGGTTSSSIVYRSADGEYNNSYKTVTFQMNGYGTQVESKRVLVNNLATAPTVPTDENATFVGWYKDEALTTPWDFATDKVTTSTTLYAKWEVLVHTHTFGTDSICTGCGAIEISAATFPDANFRSYITSQTYGTDGLLTQEELQSVTSISVDGRNIKDLTGIQHFTALKTLSCYNNQLTSLDVSGCTALNILYCHTNQLVSLDMSSCTVLEDLRCYNNQLAELDVSNCTALEILDCHTNQLVSLDVSDSTALRSLSCHSNQLTSLDMSGCTALKALYCYNNQLTSLNVSSCTALNFLGCHSNQLTDLDVSGFAELEQLSCSFNQLTELDVSGLIALKSLDCDENQLTNLDVSDCTALEYLACDNNQLTSLDVSCFTAINTLYCFSNQLTNIDVSGCTALKTLYCGINNLTSLDVSSCTALESLSCNNNQLTSLDVSKCTTLWELECDGNRRTISTTRNQFDLSTLSADGFDVTKASNWVGGTVSGNILTATADTVTYTYNVGMSKTATFTLLIEDACAQGHTWQDATCTAPKTCSVCGTTQGETLNHSYASGICTECGKAQQAVTITSAAGKQTEYDTLEDAAKAAVDGDTITLNQKADLKKALTFNSGSITLEMNGKNINVANGCLYDVPMINVSGATLTIRGHAYIMDSGSGDTNYTQKDTSCNIYVYSGKLILDNVTVYKNCKEYAMVVGSNGTVEVKNCPTFNKIVNYGDLTINNSTVSDISTKEGSVTRVQSGKCSVFNAGTLYISGGTATSIFNYTNCLTEITGGTVSGIDNSGHLVIKDDAVITGEMFMAAMGTAAISGGTFTGGATLSDRYNINKNLGELLAEGYVYFDGTCAYGPTHPLALDKYIPGDPDVTVVPAESKIVASRTEADGTVTYYVSVEEATRAGMGGVVKLLADTTLSYNTTLDYQREVLDLNGHTLTIPEEIILSISGVLALNGGQINGSYTYGALHGGIGGQCGENVWWQFRETDGTLTIFGSGDMADYAEYGNNAPWRSQYTGKIKKVVVEEGVTGIGSFSFWQCDNLEEITIAQSVQRMGDGVFYGCEKLAAVTIPNGVPTIGQNAFYGCVSLYSLHIPESVTTIGVSAFVCSGLRYVVLPKSVTKIDGNAFGGCDKLWHVLYTGTEAQRNSIEVVSDSRLYSATWHYQAAGNEISAATGSNCVENHLFYCEICKSNCVEPIYSGSHTWAEATCITPKTCSSCGATQGEANPDAHTYENSVCTGCGTIGGQCGPEVYWVLKDKEIVIYGTGKMWDFDDGSAPFYPADAVIEGVNIRPGVTTVGANAFDECDTLLYLTLPETLTSIGYKAFYNCDLLVSVPLPESLTSIGREAFRNCAKITAITIPGRVETIDRQAFGGCTGLTEIYIPDSVTHLGELAFMDCSGLREATIGNGVKSIGQYTFAQCTSLVAVKLGKRVETIGMMAFYECDQLWHVFFGGSASQWTNMSIEEHNDCLADAICHYNQSNTPGAYISYDDTVTCTRSGRYTCILCGTSKEILIPGGEHTWVDGSCTSTPHCEKCGEDGPLADGHDPEFISGQKATCEYAGWYDYYRCQDCGELFEDEACRHFIYDLTEWRTTGNGKENKLPHSEVCGVCANCGIGLNLGDYVYTLDEAAMTVTLTDYIGSGTDVHVAASYLLDGKEYRTLLEATSVFRCNTAITSVKIHDGVTVASNSMAEMFYGCAALKTADLRGLDTTGVTSLRRLFSECKKLVSVDVTGWDTSAVADMSYLFDYCNALTTITGYENWNTGSVWNINKAFNRTSTIAVVDLSKWDLSKVTNSGWCFQMCYAEEILLPDNLAVMSAGFLNHPTKYAGTTFTVPSGVKKIGYAHTIYDFGTDAFTAFEVPAQNGYYEAVDGILYSEDGTELIAVPRGKTFENGVFEVPNTVTFMGELSFSRNYNIQTLVLPDNYIIEYVPLYDSRYILTDGHGGNDTGNLNSGTNLSIAIYCYTGITRYDVRETNTRYEAVDGVIYTEDMTALVAVPARYAQNLNIPEGVTTWQKEAMWADHAGNSNLLSLLENCTGVSIPATLSQIDAEQLSMINRLTDRTSSAFTITVAEGNRTFHVNPTTGHLEAHTYSAVVTEPGCENAGYTTHTCSICEDSYKTDPVPAKEHDWADADCDTPKTCSVCGATEGNALGHDWADADCDTPKTCKVCGATEGNALGHDWADADCDTPKTCKVCGATEGTAAGHSWIEASCYNPRTCSVCGKIDSVSWGHDWQAVVDGTGEICNKCGATRGDVHSHTWLPATCSAPETCTSCGVTRGQKLPHTPVVDPAVEASCTTEGKSEGSHCSVCLQPLVVQQVIPLKAHTEVTDKTVEATCTETGLTEGKHCTVCGTVTQPQQIVTAAGHKDNDKNYICDVCGEDLCTDHQEEILPAKVATCTATGLTEGKKCARCGDILVAQQTVPTKAHTEVTDPAVAATCTTTGLTEGSHCSACGKVIKEQDKIPAMGHTPVVDAAVEATCTATGLTAGAHCVVCDAVLKTQQTVAKKDHTWKAATCSNPKTCTVCGTTSGYALGHDWAAGNCTTPKTCKVCGAKDGGVVHAYEHQYDYKCDLCGTERIVDMTRPMVDMFRMYNPNTGEHFYTGSTEERDNLIAVGWQYEGVGFTFPLTTGKPVHRLFQPSTGEHLYTMDESEKAKLMAEGWNYEGIAFNSGFENEVPQYRLWNPNATVGAYHFTASQEEKDNLLAAGWIYQGIGWYSLGA